MDWKKVCAGFAALSLGCALAGSAVAPSYAHYPDTAQWTTVLSLPASAQVVSDLLVAAGQTVLLEPDTENVAITLTSQSGAAEGSLRVTSGTYLTGSLDRTELTIPVGTAQTVNLTLIRTEKGDAITENTTESLTVTWVPKDGGRALYGVFTVTLLPKSQPTEPAAPSEPESTNTDTAETETTAPPVQLSGDAILAYTPTTSAEMPLALAVLETADTAELTWNGRPFPKGTRYCHGGHWTILAAADSIRLVLEGSGTMLLELPAGQPEANILTVTVRKGDQTLTQYVSIAYSGETAPKPGSGPLILTENGPLDIPAWTKWEGYDGQLGLSRLDSTGGITQWTSVRAEEEGIDVTWDEEGFHLSVSKDTRPPAGTYRLRQVWMFRGQEVRRIDTVFYISYSTIEVNGGTMQ